MLQFIKSKMFQKKWMMLSLLLGSILLIGVACCNPMYVHGTMQNLLTTTLRNNALETKQYPMILRTEKRINATEGNWKQEFEKSEHSMAQIIGEMKVPEKEWMKVHTLFFSEITSNMQKSEEKKRRVLGLNTMEELEEHSVAIQGRMYESSSEDGIFECVMSKMTFQKLNLILDEVITIEESYRVDGKPIKLRVVGVFDVKDSKDAFWEKSPNDFEMDAFISKESFLKIAEDTCTKDSYIIENHMIMLDYTLLKYKDINEILEKYPEIREKGIKCNFIDKLSDFNALIKRVNTTMNILQIPTLIILAIFIFMVASQMLSMEQSEISMLKSRGVSRFQIVLIYFLQSTILSTISLILGIPLGYFLCRVLGVSNSFMEMVARKALPITFTREALVYAVVAAVFSVFVMTAPVLSLSKTSIVEAKQKKKKHEKPIWKRGFIDILILAVSLYGFYNFNRQKEDLVYIVLDGKSLDPLLFFSSALFLLGCSMLIARWVPVFIKAIYILFKKKWSIGFYTAFLQTIRTKEKQNFIIIFLSVTIALGIFNANTARTINDNKETDIRYSIGADIVVKEAWRSNLAGVMGTWIYEGDIDIEILPRIRHSEADIRKYDEIEEYTNGFTKVYNEKDVIASPKMNSTMMNQVQLMGIHTKEFGEVAWMKEDLTDPHWYYSLNELAKDTNNILMSENAKENLGLKIGDVVEYERFDEIGRIDGKGEGVICGFVKYFPSYIEKVEIEDTDKTVKHVDQYLIVAHFEELMNAFGMVPYEIWFSNKENSAYMHKFVKENEIRMERFKDAQNEIVKMKNDPMVQGTNGFLTISFLATITVCSIGCLIYWILSMRDRELLFGIYRAMGLSLRELFAMLISEQLFVSLGAVVLGALTGIGASYLYIPLIEIAFTAGGISNLPTDIVRRISDMTSLIIIVCLVLTVCTGISISYLKKLKIAQALKLGEE